MSASKETGVSEAATITTTTTSGDGNVTDTPQGASTEAPAAGGASTTAQGLAEPVEQTGTAEPKVKIEGDLDPARAAKAIESARAAEAREKAKYVELTTMLKQALGIEDKKVDPAKVAEALAAQNSEVAEKLRRAEVRNGVLRVASKLGADAEALDDSKAFEATVASLDPSSSTFLDDVETAIKAAVKANPRLKSAEQQTPKVTRAGVPLNGAGPDGKPSKPASLADAIQARFGT